MVFPLNLHILKSAQKTPMNPPFIAKPCNITSVESSTSTTNPVPPDASLMLAPELPIRVSRLNPRIKTFSVHVPKTVTVFGPAGLIFFSAEVIVDNCPFPPHSTLRSAPCAVRDKPTRNAKTSAGTSQCCVSCRMVISPFRDLQVRSVDHASR